MASFMIVERREAGEDDAETIRDGFSVLALLFPLVWMLWHRLWIEAAAYLTATLLLMGAGWLLGMGDAAAVLALPLNLLLGFEAQALRHAALLRRGWSDWGVVEAGDSREALMRYLAEAGHLDTVTESEPALPMRYTHAAASGPALGLFAYPDRR
jgi:hypothetical protein